MARTTDIKFSDFAISFIAHPNTGDISLLTNEEAVKRAVRNLVLTGYNERLFSPGKGCGVYHLLFELISSPTANGIEEHIRAVLQNWEPRIIVSDVFVIPDYDAEGYSVTISFEVVNETMMQSINFFLEMIR